MNIEILEKSPAACNFENAEYRSKANRLLTSRLGGEPLGILSPDQLSEYSQVLHEKSGLSKKDARRLFKTVRNRYEHADEKGKLYMSTMIKAAIEGFKRIKTQNNSTQEVTVFNRR